MQLDYSSIAGAANKFGIGGGTTAVVGWLNASDIATFIGALAAVVGVGVSWYYKRKADQRDAELHAARLQEIRDERQGD